MYKHKLTFKKDYSYPISGLKIAKGDTLIIENHSSSSIYYDQIKDAVMRQYGKTCGPITTDYYTMENLK